MHDAIRAMLAVLVMPASWAGVPAPAKAETAVEIINASTPTRCAEEDNVYIKLQGEQVRRFRIEARHPAYLGTIVTDRWDPDFTDCNMPPAAAYPFEPRRLTIYETDDWQLVGFTFSSFWRPNSVPVRVGTRVETGIHLLQLWTRFQERAEEVLVLYPTDGYWRARPLAPRNLRATAYGSSFLVGPVEEHGRPLVDLKEVAFAPASRTFSLTFVRGGVATLRLDTLDQDRIGLEVALQPPVGPDQPFAALRSMHVSEANGDVAHVAWRVGAGPLWQDAQVMSFQRARAVELWSGRRVPSHHNTSAPDVTFRDFRADER